VSTTHAPALLDERRADRDASLFGRWVLAQRTARSMSQVQFGQLVGRTQAIISKWERGTSLPARCQLAALFDALQLDDAQRLEAAAFRNRCVEARRSPRDGLLSIPADLGLRSPDASQASGAA
jgi:transcriptional regulator with XRE-family HTH domain